MIDDSVGVALSLSSIRVRYPDLVEHSPDGFLSQTSSSGARSLLEFNLSIFFPCERGE